jgi:hypothetical protein
MISETSVSLIYVMVMCEVPGAAKILLKCQPTWLSIFFTKMMWWAYWAWRVLLPVSMAITILVPFLSWFYMPLIAYHTSLGLLLQSFA